MVAETNVCDTVAGSPGRPDEVHNKDIPVAARCGVAMYMTMTPNFFDYGETVLLLHCKIQQTTFKRTACLTQALEPARLERVKYRQRSKPNLKHSQLSRQLSFTGPSDYHLTPSAHVSVWSTIVSGNRRRFRTCELARGVQNLRVLLQRVTSIAHLVFRHTGGDH